MGNISPNNLSMTPWGQLRISQDALSLFREDFSITPDIVNRWKSVGANGGVAPAWSAGQMNLVGGTTANGYSLFQTLRTFYPTDPAYLFGRFNCNVSNLAQTAFVPNNNYILIGSGTVPATPTIAAPATDGYFWEFGLTGKLTPVVYQGGARLALPDLTAGQGGGSLLQIGDIAPHRYYTYFRGDSFFAAIDGIFPENSIVSQFSSGASGPNVNTLPLTFLVISNGGAAANLQLNAVILGDTGRNWSAISNAVGFYPNAPTVVTSAAADTALAAANANRVQMIISNDSTSKLYVLVDVSGAAAASATNYTYVVGPGATFEFPNPVSTARIRGFWSAANGTAAVTDISFNPTGL